MSFVRTNKQAYAILSDISGNSVTVSGSSLKVAVTDPLPAGTNTIGGLSSVVPGTGYTQLGTAHGGDVSSTNVGVAMMVISDDGLTGLVDGSYTQLHADGSGALYVRVSAIDTITSITNDVNVSGIGFGANDIAKLQDGDVAAGQGGVVGMAIADNDLDGLVDGSYTMFRTDGSGAQWVHLAPGTESFGTVTVGNTVTITGSVTTNGSTGAVTTAARSYADGVVYDGSFTSQDTTCYDLSAGTIFSFAGRAQSGGADVSFALAMYACSGAAHGTPNTSTTAGDMFDTGHVIQNLSTGGPFFATFNDLGFPFVSFKNVTNATTGNTADICLVMHVYRR